MGFSERFISFCSQAVRGNELMRATNLLVGVATFLTAVGQLQAGLMTFSTSDSPFIPGTDNQGWLSPTSSNTAGNDNYFTGIDLDGNAA